MTHAAAPARLSRAELGGTGRPCASCTSGSASSTARIRPGTPSAPTTAPSGGSRGSPCAARGRAELLTAQDGLYSLIERGTDGRPRLGDRQRRRGARRRDAAALRRLLAAPRDRGGHPDDHRGRVPTATADRRDGSSGLALDAASPARPRTARRARRRSGAARSPSCRATTCPPTAAVARDGAPRARGGARPGTRGLDRRDRELRLHLGRPDHAAARPTATSRGAHGIRLGRRAPVVTEPFSDWVLAGASRPAGPRWESAGARFVDDIEPFERRKLWLLNGAHALLAYRRAGSAGTQTVAAGDRRPGLPADSSTSFWDEAARHLPTAGLDLAGLSRRSCSSASRNPRHRAPARQIAEQLRDQAPRAHRARRARRTRGRTDARTGGLRRRIAAWARSSSAPARLRDREAVHGSDLPCVDPALATPTRASL